MKQFSPAAERNRSYIFDVIEPFLPPNARVLEIASGTGQHAVYVCEKRTDIVWQPTDVDPFCLASVEAYRRELELFSLLEPILFDIGGDIPMVITKPYDLIVNINMIHISPWDSAIALLNRASHLLKSKGILYLYGPFRVKGEPLAPSNEEFDRSLKSRNAEWGLRELEVFTKEAEKRSLHFLKSVAMPAHNLSVIFQKG